MHESAPVDIAGLRVTAMRAETTERMHTAIAIEPGTDGDDPALIMRLDDIPALLARLLDLYHLDTAA
jgi:hypothetical protein